MSARLWFQITFARTTLSALLLARFLNPLRLRPSSVTYFPVDEILQTICLIYLSASRVSRYLWHTERSSHR